MNHLHVKYLLVGGGVASCSAAQAIRAHDAEGSVLLVGQEINRPYHRPPLSKAFLRRTVGRDALFAVDAGWFEAHRVELRTGRRVSHLDTARHVAALDNGEEVSFDRLLLATGATPAPLNLPGALLPNAFTVRTLEDAAHLHNAIDKAKQEGRAHPRGRGRVVVIGGGVLGVELAASLTQMGMAVDLVEEGPHLWDRFAGESTGRFLGRYLQKHAVDVHTDAHAARLEGDGRVQRVIVRQPSGEQVLPCDFAVSAVGANANKEVLRGTPIAAEREILVDERCRTSVPDIYAAGDCCAILDPLFGKYLWLDHWDNAVRTGTIAGHNMAGFDDPYRAVNTFITEAFDLTARVWGAARLVDRRLMRGVPQVDAPALIEIGIADDGRVAQVLAVGHADQNDVLEALVAQRVRLEGREEAIKDPQFRLRDLLNG